MYMFFREIDLSRDTLVRLFDLNLEHPPHHNMGHQNLAWSGPYFVRLLGKASERRKMKCFLSCSQFCGVAHFQGRCRSVDLEGCSAFGGYRRTWVLFSSEFSRVVWSMLGEPELFQAQGGVKEKFSVLFKFCRFSKSFKMSRDSLLKPSLPFSEFSRVVRSTLGEPEFFQAQGGVKEKFSVLFKFCRFLKGFTMSRYSLLKPCPSFSANFPGLFGRR